MRGSFRPGTASGTASVVQPMASNSLTMASLPLIDEGPNIISPALLPVGGGSSSRLTASIHPPASNTASPTASVKGPTVSQIGSLDGFPPPSPSVRGAASYDNHEVPFSDPPAGSAVMKKKRKGGDALALQEAQKLLPKRQSKRLKTNKH